MSMRGPGDPDTMVGCRRPMAADGHELCRAILSRFARTARDGAVIRRVRIVAISRPIEMSCSQAPSPALELSVFRADGSQRPTSFLRSSTLGLDQPNPRVPMLAGGRRARPCERPPTAMPDLLAPSATIATDTWSSAGYSAANVSSTLCRLAADDPRTRSLGDAEQTSSGLWAAGHQLRTGEPGWHLKRLVDGGRITPVLGFGTLLFVGDEACLLEGESDRFRRIGPAPASSSDRSVPISRSPGAAL